MDGVSFFEIIGKEILSEEERIEIYKRILFLLVGKIDGDFDTETPFLRRSNVTLSPKNKIPF